MTLEQVLSNKPFIICEIGSNWDTLDDCIESIGAAKRAGANAVKFQMFDLESLYGFVPKIKHVKIDFWGRKRTFKTTREPLHGGIHRDWVEILAEKCKAQSIEFMCTPFSVEDAIFLDPFVNYHKVASSDMTYKMLLETMATFNKPIFFSTGAHTIKDIERVLTLLGSVPSVIMYCVSAYPAKTVRLENIRLLHGRFKNYVGFSDHTTQIFDIPKRAVDMGAVVIEKHFKLRDMDTPDNAHSLNPMEFELMVKNIKEQLPMTLETHEELDMRTMHVRRLIATADIKRGDVLTYGLNYGAFRSLKPDGHALSDWLCEDINGKVCNHDIPLGDVIEIKYIL